MFEFLWNHKPDKAERKTICGDYSQGGLKMVNIFLFEKALKITWIRRTINQKDIGWNKILHESNHRSINNWEEIFLYVPEILKTNFG